MSQVVIHAEGLGKRYSRGKRDSNTSLREALMCIVRSPLSVFRRAPEDTFWALRDVTLDVHEGEVLGLIGRNGAGKTTLLKILSRITCPTTGWAEIRGRIRSLLEVGTGFHPELTGRENTYLNGAILGMGKAEIDRKFDEIVAFAEIDKFIDTPVKRYSSGMYVRLAFAVAAHLEPEILLVDEVLAVGDLAFQKKCLGKMGEVASRGRTIVFVSHQLNQIRRLCDKAVWLDQGSIFRAGPTAEVAGAYEASMMNRSEASRSRDIGAPEIHNGFVGWEIVEPRPVNPHMLTTLGPVQLKFVLRLNEQVRDGTNGIALFDHERRLMWAWAAKNLSLPAGTHELFYGFPTLPLKPGLYTWEISFYDGNREVDAWSCVPGMIIATEVHQHPYDKWNGVLNVPCQFSISPGVSHAQEVRF